MIELLVVITIISILMAAVYFTVDPPALFASARNARRWGEIDSIAKAIRIYEIKEVMVGLDSNYSKAQVLGTDTAGCDSACGAKETVPSCLDIREAMKSLLPEIPYDPKTGTEENTDYYVNKDENGILEVGACDSELEEIVYLKR